MADNLLKRQWRDIRRFVTFDVDWSKPIPPSDKRLIRRYWEAIQSLQARGGYPYRPRSTDRLRRAQAYAQHPPGLPQLSVAFIPTATPGTRPTIRFRQDGGMVIRTDHVARVVWQLVDFERRKGESATDPLTVVQRILKRDRYSREFRLTCGEHESSSIFDRKTVAKEVAAWVNQYGNWQKWLTGVIGYRFIAQADADAYYAARRLATKTAKKRRAKRDLIRDNER